jgi:putative transposase
LTDPFEDAMHARWPVSPASSFRGLTDYAAQWPWSSVHAHLGTLDDGVTSNAPIAERYPDFRALLASAEDMAMTEHLRRAECVGRPIGSKAFLDRVGQLSGRKLEPGKRGPKRQLSALSP